MIKCLKTIFAPLVAKIRAHYIEKHKIRTHLINAIKNEHINKIKYYINKLKKHTFVYKTNFPKSLIWEFSSLYLKSQKSFNYVIFHITDIKIFKYIYNSGVINNNMFRNYYGLVDYNYKIYKYIISTDKNLIYIDEYFHMLTILINIQIYNPTNENMKKIKLLLSYGIQINKSNYICINYNILSYRNDISKLYICKMFKQRLIYI
jgi:Tfp pilus tip-associated adhesin PilY1